MSSFLSSLSALRNGVYLKQIAHEERREYILMRRMTEKSTHDSSAVKVLTIIVLIYSPITMVCVRISLSFYVSPTLDLTKLQSFFSTQFVSMQPSIQGQKLVVASNAWLFIVISAPLTIITLIVWYIWERLNRHRQRHKWANSGVISMSSL